VVVVVVGGSVVVVVVVGGSVVVVVVVGGSVVVVVVVGGSVVVVVDVVVDVVVVVEVDVVVTGVQPVGWMADAVADAEKPSVHVPCAAKPTDPTLVEKIGVVNVCDWPGASDQVDGTTPGGVLVIVPEMFGPGSLGVSTAVARHPPPSTHTPFALRPRTCADATPGPTIMKPPTTAAPRSTRRQTLITFSSWLLKSATEPRAALHIARDPLQSCGFGSSSWSRTLSA
jgi:hypothetical protein